MFCKVKQAITGYITGMINNHYRIIESMKKNGFKDHSIQLHENCINELNDLLDFVGDIPEEKECSELNKINEVLEQKINDLTVILEVIIKG